MLNQKTLDDAQVSFIAFEARYEEFVRALSDETDFRYGKCYRHLKEVRREAGKLGNALKRACQPSRFLEAALVAYDYSDALAVRAAQLAEVDRQARVCAAAMRVVREAVQYEFMEGAFSSIPKPEKYFEAAEGAQLAV